jgi:hypothetical protein
LQNSKAKLVDDITKQLEGNYGKQIENLMSNISYLEKSNQKEVDILTQQLEAAKGSDSFLVSSILININHFGTSIIINSFYKKLIRREFISSFC